MIRPTKRATRQAPQELYLTIQFRGRKRQCFPPAETAYWVVKAERNGTVYLVDGNAPVVASFADLEPATTHAARLNAQRTVRGS